MPLSFPIMFLLITLAGATLLVAGVSYYLRTRQNALSRRIEELQEQSMTGSGLVLLGGDFWDTLLRATYGTILGKSWFRQKEVELMRAGFRGPRVVKIYGVASLVFTVTLLAAAVIALQGQDLSMWLLGLAGALVLGYFIPEQVLTSLRSRHRLSLMAALPDTTDMLSIVLGAGLSLDQAIARVGEEIRFVYPELADEFYWMTLEVQAGQQRAVAFQHMAQRTGLTDIRSLASMIVQAERFGTGLSQALRIYADSVRMKRRLEIEASINKAAVKMVFPIVLFILPALFIVILAPGILSILRDLAGLGQ
ncbi:MAG: type II secretion system F family protein [Bryobacterales bacterium]|nr:type II secretion system F family protein [Bryobacterales bacterium]